MVVGDEKAETGVVADALSFNARLWREGKPTSFKLELYVTDSVVGLSGRGYLGKGALKGWLTGDSIKVFFPGTNEYLYESLDQVAHKTDCPVTVTGLNLLGLATTPPDSAALANRILVTTDNRRQNRLEFDIGPTDTSCVWQVNLIYDREKSGWSVRDFRFVSGDELVLKATRERYRQGVRVPRKRFEVVIPPDATRITP
ncbi:MAG: hypothetical protein AB1772_06430 [Candidatus Zixiibacteriota bacterium]